MTTAYLCDACGEHHDGIPLGYRLDFADGGYEPDAVRVERDGELIAAGDDRFILANIELPVAGASTDTFVWTCWMSLSHQSYERIRASWDDPGREHQEPAFSYVANALPTYEPTTLELKANVHSRRVGLRPWVELQPTEHALAVEQREGIRRDRILALYHIATKQATS
ncbi:MAG TPA: DUF2199 domain-containing protein [Candidatus Elarobacter sp.]